MNFGVDLFQSLHRRRVTEGSLANRTALGRLERLNPGVDDRSAAFRTDRSSLDLPTLGDAVPLVLTGGCRRRTPSTRCSTGSSTI